MNTVKLMSEVVFHDINVITESNESNNKDLFIEGIFMQAEQRNRNGRIYPANVLTNQVNKYNELYVNMNRAMGELNHPPSPSVDPKEASHLITSLVKEGNNFMGRAKILNTPVGLTVKALIEGGVNLGVSSRGLGSLKEGRGQYSGSKIVQDDFNLVTVDIVSDPSAPDAWVNGIFESVDYIIQEGTIKEVNIVTLKKQRDIAYIDSKRNECHAVANAKALLNVISNLK